MKPGPKMGALLDVLLGEVIEDADKNNKEYLLKRVLELDNYDLEELREKAKDLIEEKREEEDKNIKQQFKV